jgi:hypothetical protein
MKPGFKTANRHFSTGSDPDAARVRALAQFRGINLESEERMRRSSEKAAGAVLPQLLKNLRMESRRGEAEIVKVWNNLIDPLLTAHAQPDSLVRGTLFVRVDSSVWLAEIVRFRRREIKERLQHAFGSEMIKKVSFRCG